MDKLTFLTYSQVYGDLFNSNSLVTIKREGPLAAITDFSILLGGEVSEKDFTSEGKELKHRTGWYWTKTKTMPEESPFVVSYHDIPGYFSNTSEHKIGGRIALQYSLISNNVISKVRRPDGILEIEYGYYPQWAPSHDFQKELNFALETRRMKELKDCITIIPTKANKYNIELKKQGYIIFEYKEKKYICVKANPHEKHFTLSNGTKYTRNEEIWIEISPVKWLVDEGADIAISKNILFAGVQFNKGSYYGEDFSKTDISWFMNTYLINDLFKCNSIINTSNPTREQLLEEIKELKEKLEESNRRNNELEKENTSYKQRIRRIQDITKE